MELKVLQKRIHLTDKDNNWLSNNINKLRGYLNCNVF